MRHIVHEETPPESLVRIQRENPCPANPKEAWETFDKSELRDHLWLLQHGLCGYCERSVDTTVGKCSIEHIHPKSQNRQLTFHYENLILSCTDQNTCNHHKGDKWDNGFIAPTQAHCEISFSYKRDGSIEATSGPYEKDAKVTITLLNLNQNDLRTTRRQHLQSIEGAIVSMQDQPEALAEYLNEELALGGCKPFYSAKQQQFSLGYHTRGLSSLP